MTLAEGAADDEAAIAVSTPSARPRYRAEREIRFAVGMYGGVSLAVYIYGVARELLNLVKATAPATAAPECELAFPEVGSTAEVYRRLAQVLGSSPDEGVEPEAPVRTRFVVDILSGSSAGGLNGICLATALAGDCPGRDPDLETLSALWLDEGDLARLVADERSTWRYDSKGKPIVEDGEPAVDPRLRFESPVSLLNGRRLLVRLAETLKQLSAVPDEREPCRSRLVDELDLWVTATDLGGLLVRLPLANCEASELQHGMRFHFRYDVIQGRNDFLEPTRDFLAFGGRSTSSFPAAFEPMRLETLAPHWSLNNDWGPLFYSEYEGADPLFPARAFSDGGILDNKPFSYATDSLARRRARLAVERKLLYVEPDPTEPETDPRAWDAVETVHAALIGIPRAETIREDVELVLGRNREIARARDLLACAGTDGLQQEWLRAAVFEPPEQTAWLSASLEETVAHTAWLGPTYTTYHRLKVRVVADHLAELLGRSLALDPDRPETFALRAVVRAWLRGRYGERGAGGEGGESENRFLFHFDVPYRLRRVAFVLGLLRDLEQGDQLATQRALATAGVLLDELPQPSEGDRWTVFRNLRATLDQALLHFLRISPRGPALALANGLAARGITREWLSELAAIADGGTRLENAAGRVPTPPEPFAPLDELAKAIEWAAIGAAELVDEALGRRLGDRAKEGDLPDPTRDLGECVRYVARFHYDAFEAFDLVYLPLSFGTAIADTNAIDVVRVSPKEGSAPPGVTETALLGAGLAHFAAFLDRGWRRHDIAWGRLNAAETVIRSLLGEDPRAEELVREARERIVAEYREEATKEGAHIDERSGWLGGVVLSPQPEPKPTVSMLERGGLVAADVGASLLGRRTGDAEKAAAVRELLKEILGRRYGRIRAAFAALRTLWPHLPRSVRVGIVLVLTAFVAIVAAALLGAEYLTLVAVALGFALLGAAGVVLSLLWYAIGKVRGLVVGQVGRLFEPAEPRRSAPPT